VAEALETILAVYLAGFIMAGLTVAFVTALNRPNDGILEIGMLAFFYAVFWPLATVVCALGSLGKVLVALLRMN